MDLIDLKEKIGKIRCVLDRIRYKKGKHLYLAIFFMIFLMIASFLFIFIFQRQQISTKENILKSYYSDTEKSIGDASASLNTADSSQAITSISSDTKFGENIETSVIKIYICGHIKTPGVYDIENGSRLVDLVSLAGGATEDACLEAVNLAQILADSQKFYIPSLDEIKNGVPSFFNEWEDINSNSSDSTSTNMANSESYQNKVININFASLSELVQLPGIGNVIAQNIIDYRNKYGQFKSKEELKNVKGIGEKKFEIIKDSISV
ncbi:MAG: helix-hairpin-helix domain-containing protein [Actinomycetia bacterium]|nr:helix-hairpin-helix domain-containing protein [Actinomycetota bacterium]MCG2790105.1 helix-hairpin-helix domain-containing protein [Actinomycetes bacterium]